MNVELMEEVAAKLRRLRHKNHFEMEYFMQKTECGTAWCIGGCGLLLAGYKPVYGPACSFDGNVAGSVLTPRDHKETNVWVAAKRVFRLTEEQADRLFDAAYWPIQFDSKDPKSAADRIDWFIKTKGRE